MSDSWRLTLPCTAIEAVTIADAELDGVVLVTSEEDEAAGRWRLDAWLDHDPAPPLVAAIRALVPSAAGHDAVPERVEERDWVTLSQAGLEPVAAGRFFVHTAAHAGRVPADAVSFRIEAGQAFGTGHHETTAGCLAMIDTLAGERFANVVDLGTGTGLLAFAAAHLWPDARVLATDIDAIAIAVTRENMAANAIPPARVGLLVADGARDPAIVAAAPFDLVVANILAGPLIAMAAEIAAIAAPGARVVLAGLLSTQAAAVTDAYRAAGCTLDVEEQRGDWSILRLTAGTTPGGAGTTDAAAMGGRGGWATDGR